MKIKAEELIKSTQVLTKVFNSPMENAKTAYALTKIQKVIDRELKDIDETRVKIAEKHSKKDKDGKPKTEEKEGRETYVFEDNDKFDEEYKKFLEETEIEIDTWMIPFEAVDKLKLSVNELSLIDFILKEPVDDVLPKE